MEGVPRNESPRELAERFYSWESAIRRETLAKAFGCSESSVTLGDVHTVLTYARFAGEHIVTEALKHMPETDSPETYLERIRLKELQIHDLIHSSIAWKFRGTPVPGFLSIRENKGNNPVLIEEELMTNLYGTPEFGNKPLLIALTNKEDTESFIADVKKRNDRDELELSKSIWGSIVEDAEKVDRTSFDGIMKTFMTIGLKRGNLLNTSNLVDESHKASSGKDGEGRSAWFDSKTREFWTYANALIKNPGKIRDEAFEIYSAYMGGNKRANLDQFIKNISRSW